jgi:hypothetical protein
MPKSKKTQRKKSVRAKKSRSKKIVKSKSKRSKVKSKPRKMKNKSKSKKKQRKFKMMAEDQVDEIVELSQRGYDDELETIIRRRNRNARIGAERFINEVAHRVDNGVVPLGFLDFCIAMYDDGDLNVNAFDINNFRSLPVRRAVGRIIMAGQDARDAEEADAIAEMNNIDNDADTDLDTDSTSDMDTDDETTD